MPVRDQDFEIDAGDDKTVRFTVEMGPGAPPDLTGATVRWGAAASREDAAVLIDKPNGAGAAVADAVNRLVDVTLAPADTAGLDGRYEHWLLVTTGSKTFTGATGIMAVRQSAMT